MHERRDPLEGFDWVFRNEDASHIPEDAPYDSFEMQFGRGPTLHDMDVIAARAAEAILPQPAETFSVMRSLREHPRLRRTFVRVGLGLGAVIAGVSMAFITASPDTVEASPAITMPSESPTPSLVPATSRPPTHMETSKSPTVRTPKNQTPQHKSLVNMSLYADQLPRPGLSPSASTSQTISQSPRPESPSTSAQPSVTPSESGSCSPSPSPTESSGPSSTDSSSEVAATSSQPETPLASQSPELGG